MSHASFLLPQEFDMLNDDREILWIFKPLLLPGATTASQAWPLNASEA